MAKNNEQSSRHGNQQKWRAFCCSVSKDCVSFNFIFETQTLPRIGDTISLYSNEHDFACEMDVSSIAWQLEKGMLFPTVHLHATGGCKDEDFRAFGWKS